MPTHQYYQKNIIKQQYTISFSFVWLIGGNIVVLTVQVLTPFLRVRFTTVFHDTEDSEAILADNATD